MADLALPDPDDEGPQGEGDFDPTLLGLARYEVERLIVNVICIWAAICGLTVMLAYLKQS